MGKDNKSSLAAQVKVSAPFNQEGAWHEDDNRIPEKHPWFSRGSPCCSGDDSVRAGHGVGLGLVHCARQRELERQQLGERSNARRRHGETKRK